MYERYFSTISPLTWIGFEMYRQLLEKIPEGVNNRFDDIATRLMEAKVVCFTRAQMDKAKLKLELENLFTQLKVLNILNMYTSGFREVIDKVPLMLVPPVNQCTNCNETLVFGKVIEPFMYGLESVEVVKVHLKECPNTDCCASAFGLTYYKLSTGEKFGYPSEDLEHDAYFQMNKDTIYSKKLLIQTENELYYNMGTFEGTTKVYNDTNSYSTRFKEDPRKPLPPPNSQPTPELLK